MPRGNLMKFKLIQTPRWSMRYELTIKILLILGCISLFLPWQQFSNGQGKVMALDPAERVQEITAPISGVIKKWYVTDGDEVKKGDILVELSDIDPGLSGRLETDKMASEKMLQASISARETAKINVDRQKKLFEQGLTSRKEYEKAKIELTKLEMEISKSQSTLLKSQRDLSRQQSQTIFAPRDGFVVRSRSGDTSQIIKAGEPLIIFAPKTTSLIVELWVSPSDASLIPVNSKARIQFAGWPAIQVPGWPSIAIGTFKGRVKLIDASSSYQGKFRVLISPDESWPSELFIKQGATASGFINIGVVPLWWEIWRVFNDIPPVSAPIKDELNKILTKKKEETDEEEKK